MNEWMNESRVDYRTVGLMHSMQTLMGHRRRSPTSCNDLNAGVTPAPCRLWYVTRKTRSSTAVYRTRWAPLARRTREDHLTSWPSWCTAACTVRHLSTSSTISLQPPTPAWLCSTDNNFSYRAVDSTTHVLVRRCGTRYLTNSETRQVVRTDLSSSWRHWHWHWHWVLLHTCGY